MDRDDLKSLMREAIKESMQELPCHCRLEQEGISPATHVAHHKAWSKLLHNTGKLTIAVVAAVATCIFEIIKHIMGVVQ